MDDGKVERFDSDIDGYPKWLATRKQRPADRVDVSRTGGRNSKKQKRQDAAARRLQQPKLNRLKQLEKEIEKLTRRKTELETILADSDIYQPDQKSLLTEALEEQTALKQALLQLEDEWMLLGEELENQ